MKITQIKVLTTPYATREVSELKAKLDKVRALVEKWRKRAELFRDKKPPRGLPIEGQVLIEAADELAQALGEGGTQG